MFITNWTYGNGKKNKSVTNNLFIETEEIYTQTKSTRNLRRKLFSHRSTLTRLFSMTYWYIRDPLTTECSFQSAFSRSVSQTPSRSPPSQSWGAQSPGRSYNTSMGTETKSWGTNDTSTVGGDIWDPLASQSSLQSSPGCEKAGAGASDSYEEDSGGLWK